MYYIPRFCTKVEITLIQDVQLIALTRISHAILSLYCCGIFKNIPSHYISLLLWNIQEYSMPLYHCTIVEYSCYPSVPASAGPSSVPAGNAQRSSLGFQPEGLLHHLLPRSYRSDYAPEEEKCESLREGEKILHDLKMEKISQDLFLVFLVFSI